MATVDVKGLNKQSYYNPTLDKNHQLGLIFSHNLGNPLSEKHTDSSELSETYLEKL